jgi:putative tRNA adenosine deaminase-associated protein
MSEDDIDFAVAAYLEEGMWQVQALPRRAALEFDDLVTALRPWPADTGVLGLVAVDEDFFVLVRVRGDHVDALLSDVTAATEWPLAAGVLDLLDLPDPDDDEDPQPAGDLGLLADLGVTAIDLALLLEDDRYPDEVLGDVARRIGFGRQFDAAVEAVTA